MMIAVSIATPFNTFLTVQQSVVLHGSKLQLDSEIRGPTRLYRQGTGAVERLMLHDPMVRDE